MDVKLILLAAAVLVASVSAAPSALLGAPAPLAYAAPGFVTASSSQVVARNYNGLAPVVPAAPYIAAPAPYVAPFTSPYVASPYVDSPYAYSSPYVW